MNSLIGNINLFGNVRLGKGLLLEDYITLGHPSPVEILDVSREEFDSLHDYYNHCSLSQTTISDSSIIRSGTIIYSGVFIGKKVDCGHNVLIRENTYVGDDTYIKSYADIQKNVTIGNNCRIGGLIADNVRIGNNVSSFGIITHRHVAKSSLPIPAAIIEDNCIIGRGAVIIGGVRIGKNSIIGANTFVNFDVPENSFIIGKKGERFT